MKFECGENRQRNCRRQPRGGGGIWGRTWEDAMRYNKCRFSVARTHRSLKVASACSMIEIDAAELCLKLGNLQHDRGQRCTQAEKTLLR